MSLGCLKLLRDEAFGWMEFGPRVEQAVPKGGSFWESMALPWYAIFFSIGEQ